MFEYVCKILADQLGLNAADITAESKLVDDLGADSLDALQMLMVIEDTKGVTIPDEDLAGFRTVGVVVAYLEQHA